MFFNWGLILLYGNIVFNRNQKAECTYIHTFVDFIQYYSCRQLKRKWAVLSVLELFALHFVFSSSLLQYCSKTKYVFVVNVFFLVSLTLCERSLELARESIMWVDKCRLSVQKQLECVLRVNLLFFKHMHQS